jgi:hypothetical protein
MWKRCFKHQRFDENLMYAEGGNCIRELFQAELKESLLINRYFTGVNMHIQLGEFFE